MYSSIHPVMLASASKQSMTEGLDSLILAPSKDRKGDYFWLKVICGHIMSQMYG